MAWMRLSFLILLPFIIKASVSPFRAELEFLSGDPENGIQLEVTPGFYYFYVETSEDLLCWKTIEERLPAEQFYASGFRAPFLSSFDYQLPHESLDQKFVRLRRIEPGELSVELTSARFTQTPTIIEFDCSFEHGLAWSTFSLEFTVNSDLGAAATFEGISDNPPQSQAPFLWEVETESAVFDSEELTFRIQTGVNPTITTELDIEVVATDSLGRLFSQSFVLPLAFPEPGIVPTIAAQEKLIVERSCGYSVNIFPVTSGNAGRAFSTVTWTLPEELEGHSDQVVMSSTSLAFPVDLIEVPGIYEFTLTLENFFGNEGSQTFEVEVASPQISAPTIEPNGIVDFLYFGGFEPKLEATVSYHQCGGDLDSQWVVSDDFGNDVGVAAPRGTTDSWQLSSFDLPPPGEQWFYKLIVTPIEPPVSVEPSSFVWTVENAAF